MLVWQLRYCLGIMFANLLAFFVELGIVLLIVVFCVTSES
jgi:hypothetical protein